LPFSGASDGLKATEPLRDERLAAQILFTANLLLGDDAFCVESLCKLGFSECRPKPAVHSRSGLLGRMGVSLSTVHVRTRPLPKAAK